jgi:putative tricarboxylic transport membrane protein
MKRDQVGGFFFAFIGVIFFLLSIKLPTGKLTQPGPGVFPLALSLLLCTVGLMIFFSTTKEKTKIDWRKGLPDLAKPAAIVLLTLAYIILLGRLGYLLTSFIYLFSLFLLVSRYKWFFSAGLSGALAIASWIFFGKILGIQLPLGPWNL